jgi:hypothetical protein
VTMAGQSPSPHVQRRLGHCACGRPWPCRRSAEGKWQELRAFHAAEIARLEPMASMKDPEADEMAAGVAAGGQEAHEATLAKMTELEAGR